MALVNKIVFHIISVIKYDHIDSFFIHRMVSIPFGNPALNSNWFIPNWHLLSFKWKHDQKIQMWIANLVMILWSAISYFPTPSSDKDIGEFLQRVINLRKYFRFGPILEKMVQTKVSCNCQDLRPRMVPKWKYLLRLSRL